jgi:hypothetical protein
MFDLDVLALALGSLAFVWTLCAVLLLADLLGPSQELVSGGETRTAWKDTLQ